MTPADSPTSTLNDLFHQACEHGDILSSTQEQIRLWMGLKSITWIQESLSELILGKHWSELNDRFYKTLAFGTGGLRGRTLGKIVTRAEQGDSPEGSCPKHPAAGSNCMNDFNVRRATMGLVAYLKTQRTDGKPVHLVFAHDTRLFSRHFAELAARTVVESGGKASLFEAERSTPELSFAVRHLEADGGVVITASHNPPHDNGFKAYFKDGAQVVEPHASKIIDYVMAVPFDEAARAPNNQATFQNLGSEIDEAYLSRLRTLILEPEVVRQHASSLKVVYTPLHGCGMKIVPTILGNAGFDILTVPSQAIPDGRFPTVKSPNPENAEALSLSLQLAEKEHADLVLATDPDADRMGVALRGPEGKMMLINGNTIGSLLAHYRLDRLFKQGVLNDRNRSRARLIKTVVTTHLQKAIAEKFGVEIPETLTGFKYIGAKLLRYESQLLAATGITSIEYRNLSEDKKRSLLLEHSAYYVFGGEESYGYSASDFARDKDANAACLMFVELAVYARSLGVSVYDYLQQIYCELGYFQEQLGQLVFEGADGAARIQKILTSYQLHPPTTMAGLKVTQIRNHGQETVKDCEGEILPKEALFFVELENGARYAVRGSGTEPKIKFYLFGFEKPSSGKSFTQAELEDVKKRTQAFLHKLWAAIEQDAHLRAKPHSSN